jgi:hypothetical protein
MISIHPTISHLIHHHYLEWEYFAQLEPASAGFLMLAPRFSVGSRPARHLVLSRLQPASRLGFSHSLARLVSHPLRKYFPKSFQKPKNLGPLFPRNCNGYMGGTNDAGCHWPLASAEITKRFQPPVRPLFDFQLSAAH